MNYIKFLKSLVFIPLIFLISCKQSNQNILYIGAIPDQNPEKLNRLYKLLSKELSNSLNINVVYRPVINYPAAVTAFRTGNLDLVWFGGLTGVQARLQTPGSRVIAQRDIDKNFRSIFIANKNSNIPKIQNINELNLLKGKRFTFGSESSTSGRLMPQYFLLKANVKTKDFKGGFPGFSGSHDATWALVQSGSYEAGALNEQVWISRLKEKRIDPNKVIPIWRSPSYADYHWLARPDLDKRLGKGFTNKIQDKLLGLNSKNDKQKIILELFGAKKFIKADSNEYESIKKIGRIIGKIN